MKKLYVALLSVLLLSGFTYAQSVAFNGPPSGSCPGTALSFDNLSFGCDTYLWDFGDGNTSNSTASTINHTYAQGGHYTVVLQGWSGSTYVGEYTRYLYVEGFPGHLNVNPVCPGDQLVIETGMYTADQFDWNMMDGTIYSINDDDRVFHTYSSPGIYNVSLTVDFPVCGTFSGTIPVMVSPSAEILDGFMQAIEDSVCPGDEVSFDMHWGYEYVMDYGDGSTYTSSDNLPDYGGAEHNYSGAGTYYPSVTFVNGCGNDTTVYDTVVVASGLTYVPSVQLNMDDDTICVGSENRIYTYTNASSIQYNWGDGTVETNPDYFEFKSYAAAGAYPITVTVTTGCGVSNSETDTLVVVTNLPITYASMDVPDTVCTGSGAFMDANIDDEDGYLWDMGDGTTYTQEEISHVYTTAGTYTVTVTATNVCGSDTVMTEQIVISDTYGFSDNHFAFPFPQEGCPGDTAFLLFIAGEGNTYEVNYGSGFVPETPILFDPGFGFIYHVIKHAYNSPGVYNAVLRTTNACGVTRLDTLQFDWTGGMIDLEVSFLYDLNKPICIGQPIKFYPVGGKNYTWNFGDGSGTVTSSGSLNTVEHVYHQPGSYTVTLEGRDQCGNMAIDTQEVVIPDTRIYVTANAIDATCGNNDGLAIASVSGGTAPYTFSWTSGHNTLIADSLESGIYQVNVVDAIGCKNFDIATVSDEEAATIVVNTVLDVSCPGSDDGAIDINIIGGNPPFTYEWSNGKTTEDVNNLAAGPYEVFVTDAYGCVATASITVGAPPSSSISFAKKNSNCGFNDGFATVYVSGTTGPYTYVWDNGSGDQTIHGLGPGIYEVNVIDGNGCLFTDQIIINDIQGPKVFLDSVSALDCGGTGSDIYIDVFGGAMPYNFNWSNGATSGNLLGVNAGDYTLVVTDNNGCQANLAVSIDVDPPSENQICMVTVDTTTHTNQLVWERADTAGIDYYNIYRESSLSGLYYLVGSVDGDSLTQYTDPVADPFIRSWRYKISAVNDCGIESDLSDIHKTIHLTSNLGVGGVVNLIWDEYEGFTYPTYYIMRYSDIDGWNLIDSVSSVNHSYTDASPPLGVTNLGYVIYIDPAAPCTPTKAVGDFNSSRSNRAQAVGDLDVPESLVELNDNLNHFKAYPNPTNGVLNVELNFLEAEDAAIQLIDLAGKTLFQRNINGYGLMLESLNLSDLSNGIYMLNVKTSSGISSTRVVIQK